MSSRHLRHKSAIDVIGRECNRNRARGKTQMLKEIKSFFADLTGGKEVAHFEDNDYRLAAAALMVHVATLERELSKTSREKLHALLKSRFELDDALTEE